MQIQGLNRPQIALTPQVLQILCNVGSTRTLSFSACRLGAETLRVVVESQLRNLTGQSVSVLGGGQLVIGQLRRLELRCPNLTSLATFDVTFAFFGLCQGSATVSFDTRLVLRLLDAGNTTVICSAQICVLPPEVERFDLFCAPPGALDAFRRFFQVTEGIQCFDATALARDLQRRGELRV